MMISLVTGVVSLSLALNSCNLGKKKTKPEPSANGYPNDPGPPGPPGPAGSGLNYVVEDGAGHLIAKTTWDNFVLFNRGQPFFMQLSDRAIFQVHPQNGYYPEIGHCRYESSDCTGICLYSGNPDSINTIVEGKDGLYWLDRERPVRQTSYLSTWYTPFPSVKFCIPEEKPISTLAAELPDLWNMPEAFEYPVPLPLKVYESPVKLESSED